MVRRYEEPIEVRAGAGGAGEGVVDRAGDINCPDPTPSAFLWRGRLYIVRDVIGHWRERRAWWREALDPVRRRPGGTSIPNSHTSEGAGHGASL